MNPKLNALIEKTKNIKMTPEQFARQRRSFVYGNTHIENERITRELVDQVDRELSEAEEAEDGRG